MPEKFLDYLQYEKRFSAHTVRAYEADLSQLIEFLHTEFETEALNNASSVELRTWVATLMDNGIAPRSIHRKVSAVKAYFRWAMKHKGITINPTVQLTLPRVSKRLPVYVEEAQMDNLCPADVFPDTFNGYRDRAVIELFYHTGMRSAELIGLTNSAIDFQGSTVRVLGKRNKERIVPVSQTVLDILDKYETHRKNLPVIKNPASFFLTEKGVRMYPKLVYRLVNHYLSRVSTLQKKSPHILRHTFATHMLNRGADLNAIKDLLGHASLAATQVYTHNSIEQLKEVHRKAHPKG